MTRRRPGCVLCAFCLSAVLFVGGCGSKPAPSVRIDPALATLVPSDTVLLAGVRLEALRTTPIYRKLVPEAFVPLPAGIDSKAVWEVLAASNGRDTAFLSRGRFSASGLEPDAPAPGSARTSYKGYSLVGSEEAAVAFMNPTTAIAGRPQAIRALIDQRGSSSGVPPRLAPELAAIEPGSQIWVAGLGEAYAIVPRTGNLGNIATALKLVERFHAAADLRAGARIDATALCRSSQDAESLAAALNAFVAFARLGNPRYQPAAAALRITAEQRTVRIGGTIPEGVLESLFEP